MNSSNALILIVSEKYVDKIKEIPGENHHPKIVEWLDLVGLKGHGDETAWCSAAMNGILRECLIKGTDSPAAKSFLKWGSPIIWEQKTPGDIMILYRGDKNSWSGHVGIYLKEDKKTKQILLRGGNQSNSFCEEWYDDKRVIGIRRATVV